MMHYPRFGLRRGFYVFLSLIYYNVCGKVLEEQYKYHLSNFSRWYQLSHAEDYVLFKNNISVHISIDETCLSRAEVYTIVSSKSADGGCGSLIAMINGTAGAQVVPVLQQISYGKRSQVKEIAAGKLAHWYNRVEKMGIPHFRNGY